MQEWMPDPGARLVDWWTTMPPVRSQRRDAWTIIILVMWSIWTHRNDSVFNDGAVSATVVVERIRNDIELWKRAKLLRGERFRFQAIGPLREHEGE